MGALVGSVVTSGFRSSGAAIGSVDGTMAGELRDGETDGALRGGAADGELRGGDGAIEGELRGGEANT
jgi:hypothetical protein